MTEVPGSMLMLSNGFGDFQGENCPVNWTTH